MDNNEMKCAAMKCAMKLKVKILGLKQYSATEKSRKKNTWHNKIKDKGTVALPFSQDPTRHCAHFAFADQQFNEIRGDFRTQGPSCQRRGICPAGRPRRIGA